MPVGLNFLKQNGIQLRQTPKVLSWLSGYKIPFDIRPHQAETPKNIQCSNKERAEIAALIGQLQEKGAVEKCRPVEGQFVSKIFLVPKPDGFSRLILNLKQLNTFIQTEHFKLEEYKAVARLLSPGSFMATLDLRDAYYMIPIDEADRRFLRFQFDSELFEFTCLPFGLSTAPYVFTKIMKPVVSYWRSHGFVVVVYVDDFILMVDSYTEWYQNIEETHSLLQDLGFIIHHEKSLMTPSQKCKYLGFVFDSIRMTVELPTVKKEKIQDLISRFSSTSACKIRDFAQFIGILVAASPALTMDGHTQKVLSERSIWHYLNPINRTSVTCPYLINYKRILDGGSLILL